MTDPARPGGPHPREDVDEDDLAAWGRWNANRVADLQAQLASVEAALEKYGQHRHGCAALQPRDFCRQHGGDGGIAGCPTCQSLPRYRDCTCGFAGAGPRAAGTPER